MIRIGILGNIGSGKSYVANQFGYPVFNADDSVAKIYLKNKKVFFKLKKKIPNFFKSFPVKKEELINAIIKNKNNIKKISSVVHPEVRKDLKIFLKKNSKQKVVILDIPLFFENKLYKKKDVIVFIQSSNKEILKRLKKRKNFNKLILQNLKKFQMPLNIKKRNSHYVIKNNFKKHLARKCVKDILKKILL